MSSLKYEMRQMFEKRQYGDVIYGSAGLEEGLVEKILNLSLFNPSVFSCHPWSILLVKSASGRQKLSRLAHDHPAFADASAVLIILKDRLHPGASPIDRQLITMSVMYASKYYGVGFYATEDIPAEELRKYFNIADDADILSLICLGYFNSQALCNVSQSRLNASYMLREV